MKRCVKLSKKNQTNRGIQSLELGINILDVFLKEGKPLTFVEVQSLTGMTKSNLYKYIYSLIKTGILHRDDESNTYVLGNKLIEYGNIALKSLDVIDRITPHVKKVSENTSFTSLLAIWSQGNPIVAHISSANYGLYIGTELGAPLPLLSSTGKIFSSFYKSKDKDEWELKELSMLSEKKRNKFLEEKQQAIEEHFTSSVDPLIEYVSSISVPIFNFQGDLIAAITVVGFTPLMPTNKEDENSKYVINIGKKVSRLFGYNLE